MSEEYESQDIESTEEVFSPFWPVFILAGGLLLWTGFQAFSTVVQGWNSRSELQAAGPTVNAAVQAQNKLYALAQDLLQTSAHDSNAAQIVKEANIQVRAPETNAPNATAPDASAPAAPPAASTNAP
jgi:hypothetical protein